MSANKFPKKALGLIVTMLLIFSGFVFAQDPVPTQEGVSICMVRMDRVHQGTVIFVSDDCVDEASAMEQIRFLLSGQGGGFDVAAQSTFYWSNTMDQFLYVWDYVPGTNQTTPEIRDDADSTGNGLTVSYDIGVNAGEFGLVTGWQVDVGDFGFGGGTVGCALVALSPGFYRGVQITSGRFEVYKLPGGNPADPTGWSGVLTDQQVKTQTDQFGCPPRSRAQVIVLYSSEQLPTAP